MIIRKHATRQQNLPDIAKTSSWRAISEVQKLLKQTTYNERKNYFSKLSSARKGLNIFIDS
jgi:hypothetical protein